MKTKWIILCAAGVLLVGYIGAVISQMNTAKNLGFDCDARLKANTATFDNMYKKIVQSSKIPGEKARQIKEILSAYVQGRGGNAGQVVSMVRESVPDIQLPEYSQLINIITGSRDSWTRNQEELVNRVTVYNKYISDVGLVRSVAMSFGGFQPKEAKLITSDKTEEAFSTGKDNDTNLF